MQHEQAELSTEDIRQLYANATLSNLPENRFLPRMQSRMRQSIRYRLDTYNDHFHLELTVLGSGKMYVATNFCHGIIENGQLSLSRDMEPVRWADTGEQALLPTALGRKHLSDGITTKAVLDAFFSAFSVIKEADHQKQYPGWMQAMQTYAQYCAASSQQRIQIVYSLPVWRPAPHNAPDPSTLQPWDTPAMYEVFDLSEDEPIHRPEYLGSIRLLQEKLNPRAARLTLFMPSLLLRQQHKEIFVAEPNGVCAQSLKDELEQNYGISLFSRAD